MKSELMAQVIKSKENKTVHGVDVVALNENLKAVKSEPKLGRAQFRARNSWEGHVLNETVIGDYFCAGQERQHKKKLVFENDEGFVLLGNEDAANPVEFILHGWAGCVTTTTVYHAVAHGIHIESLDTTLEGDLDLGGLLQTDPTVPSGYQDIRVSMRIKSDATGENLEKLKQFYKLSPVFDTPSFPVNLTLNVSAL